MNVFNDLEVVQMKFYSWKDVDRLFQEKRQDWKKYINNVIVYCDSVCYSRENGVSDENINKIFSQILEKFYNEDNKSVLLENNQELKILEEEFDYKVLPDNAPLFRNSYYKSIVYDAKENSLTKDVVAFHSYKGGVGRTLSLLAFTKKWSSIFGNKKKILIVDSDIEAPGLTWMLHSELPPDSFSYLDLLDTIQDNDVVDEIVSDCAKYIEKNTISIDDGKQVIKQFFLPLYRYKAQLMDMYSTPNVIVKRRQKNYVLAEVLSKIASKIGAEIVLVDLRAGFSEYSAPLLFDKRVKKYIVSSTSEQSIIGCREILLHLSNNKNKYRVILNMIPVDELDDSEIANIQEKMIESINVDSYHDYVDLFLPVKFSSELIHLPSFSEIITRLDNSPLYFSMGEEIKKYYCKKENKDVIIKADEKREFLEKLYNIAESRYTSEAQDTVNEMMVTNPIFSLVSDYRDGLPVSIIMGAKGVGKTFLYRRLVKEQNWLSFSVAYGIKSYDAQILPILSPTAITKWVSEIKDCTSKYGESVGISNYNNSIFADNSEQIKKILSNSEAYTEDKIIDVWRNEIIAKAIYPEAHSLVEADKFLNTKEKKVILVFDGFEDILQTVTKKEINQKIIRLFSQDIINYVSSKCRNIGIIAFIRRDMLVESIKVNFAQFEGQHKKYELSWSHKEAIKLVYWLVSKTKSERFKEIDVESTSISVILGKLSLLWGKKLGKDTSNEAYTVRWILAALSDFNGQLSARDMIRFLRNVTELELAGQNSNSNRYISAAAIKSAVQRSSKQKIDEVKQEYMYLNECFEIIEKKTVDKAVPIMPEQLPLTGEQVAAMEKAGFLKMSDNKYYLPECIREGLGFKSNSARPKVLSLMNISREFALSNTVNAEISGIVTVEVV